MNYWLQIFFHTSIFEVCAEDQEQYVATRVVLPATSESLPLVRGFFGRLHVFNTIFAN